MHIGFFTSCTLPIIKIFLYKLYAYAFLYINDYIYSEHFYGCKSIVYIKISTPDIAHYDVLNIAHHIK